MRRVMSIDDSSSPSGNESSGSSTHATLPIPNPFKGLMPLSRERLLGDKEKDEGGGKIRLSEPSDLGDVSFTGVPLGTRLTSDGEDIRILYWCEDHLLVRISSFKMTIQAQTMTGSERARSILKNSGLAFLG